MTPKHCESHNFTQQFPISVSIGNSRASHASRLSARPSGAAAPQAVPQRKNPRKSKGEGLEPGALPIGNIVVNWGSCYDTQFPFKTSCSGIHRQKSTAVDGPFIFCPFCLSLWCSMFPFCSVCCVMFCCVLILCLSLCTFHVYLIFMSS